MPTTTSNATARNSGGVTLRRRVADFAGDSTKRFAGRLGAGIRFALGSRARGRFGILVYHRVADVVPGLSAPTMSVSAAQFRSQISGLLDRGYQFWPLRQVIERQHAGREIPRNVVVLTFDDGFEGVYSGAFPVMSELSVPGTVFLNTAYLGSNAPFPFDPWGIEHQGIAPVGAYRPLNVDQCREMQSSGLVELAAHTHTHADFRERPIELLRDMQQCVAVLKSKFDVTDPTFAFPFGRPHLGFTSAELVDSVREAGVICSLTTEAVTVDPASDPYSWGRFNVYCWDDGATLAGKLAGWYGWAPRLQEAMSSRPRKRAAAVAVNA